MENESSLKTSILVVDDNPNNLQLMESMLVKFGFDVRLAMNGQDALESVSVEPPEIILLDIHMPQMDGYEVCQKLKQQESTNQIPVIFVSAITEEINKVKGFELGAIDYLTKPVNMLELKVRVIVHVQLARQHRQLVEQAEELKIFNEAMIEREMRMLELKKEVNDLSRELAKNAPYPEADE